MRRVAIVCYPARWCFWPVVERTKAGWAVNIGLFRFAWSRL